jgi:hypothetical protein
VERLVGLCFVPLIFIKNIKASRLWMLLLMWKLPLCIKQTKLLIF